MGFSKTLAETKDLAWNTGTNWSFPFKVIDPTGDEDYYVHMINNGARFEAAVRCEKARFLSEGLPVRARAFRAALPGLRAT